MTTYARIVDNRVAEVFVPPGEGIALAECFHAEVAAQFVECPDGTLPNATYDEAAGTFANAPAEPPVPLAIPRPVLTPMQLYLAFTPAERVAIKASTAAMVREFWATYELAVETGSDIDLNLPSFQAGIDTLVVAGIVTPGRKEDILSGVQQ